MHAASNRSTTRTLLQIILTVLLVTSSMGLVALVAVAPSANASSTSTTNTTASTSPVPSTSATANCSLASAGSGASIPSFAAPQVASVAGPSVGQVGIHDLATGDFNGDGIQDVASVGGAVAAGVNSGHPPRSVAIYLGNGDGTFGTPTYVPMGVPGSRITAARLEGPSTPVDLLVYGEDSGRVSLLAGHGDGTFDAPRILASFAPATRHVMDLAVGDMNGDGTPDLVVALWNNTIGSTHEGDLAILLGNGDGTFQGPRTTTVGTPEIQSLALGDFTGDGTLDVAYSSTVLYPVAVYLSRGNGDGTLLPPTLVWRSPPSTDAGATAGNPFLGLTSSSMVASGDLNGDGNLDLAIVTEPWHAVDVLLGTGAGAFAPAPTPRYDIAVHARGTGGDQIQIADLGNDGNLDIVATTGWGSTLAVLHGQGDGTFTTRVYPLAAMDDEALAVADVTGDGYPDVIVGSDRGRAQMYLTVIPTGPDGALIPPSPQVSMIDPTNPATTNAVGVDLADLNGDGVLDLVTTLWTTPYEPTTRGDLPPMPVVQASSGTVNIHGIVAVRLGNGDGSFRPEQQYYVGSRPFAVKVGDVDGDGVPDLVVGNGANSSVSVLLGVGDGTFHRARNYTVDAAPNDLALADLNGDGRPDIVTSSAADGNVSILLNQGGAGSGPAFAPAVSYPTGKDAVAVVATDVTGDGVPDLAVLDYGDPYVASSPSRLVVLQGVGDGTFDPASSLVLSPYHGTIGMAAGDLNGDGIIDLAVIDDTTDELRVLAGTGHGTFAPTGTYALGDTPQDVTIADVTSDGIPDVVYDSINDGVVGVLVGQGDGTFRPLTNPTTDAPTTGSWATFGYPAFLAVGDVDGNGAPDILATSFFEGSVTELRSTLPVTCTSGTTAPAVTLASTSSSTFGAGTPGYTQYPSKDGAHGGEPGIGVDWKTGAVMIDAVDDLSVHRVTFDNATTPATDRWQDVTPAPAHTGTSLDPVLYTDPQTGRTFAGQEVGCGLVRSTDDDGASWTPVVNQCPLPGWDHPTIGSGPFAPATAVAGALYPHVVYYCSQAGASIGIAGESTPTGGCVSSVDGGTTYGPTELLTCTLTFGHLRVGPNGNAYVPNNHCNGRVGLDVSTDDGLTWSMRQVPYPSAVSGNQHFDPSVAVGPKDTLYLAYEGADQHPYVTISHDDAVTFSQPVDLANGTGVRVATFVDTIVGDDQRAAVAFLGTTTPSTPGNDAFHSPFSGHWDLYVATTYDGGATWTVVDATPNDPVQRGDICDTNYLSGCVNNDRNLLDFMDIAVDHQGRVLVGYADGCTGSCVTDGSITQSHDDAITMARQTTGRGLFAADDAQTNGTLAAAAGGPYAGTAGSPVTLHGSASGGVAPYAFLWDLGNGATASGSDPKVTYASGGTYTVTLTVTDGAGSTATATADATIAGSGQAPYVTVSTPREGDTVSGTLHVAGSAGESANTASSASVPTPAVNGPSVPAPPAAASAASAPTLPTTPGAVLTDLRTDMWGRAGLHPASSVDAAGDAASAATDVTGVDALVAGGTAQVAIHLLELPSHPDPRNLWDVRWTLHGAPGALEVSEDAAGYHLADPATGRAIPGTVHADAATPTLLITVPASALRARAGDVLAGLHVTTLAPSGEGLVPSDRAPDEGGFDVPVFELLFDATTTSTRLYLHGGSESGVGLPNVGNLGVQPATLSTDAPASVTPVVHTGSTETLPVVATSAAYDQGLTLGDANPNTSIDAGVADLYVATWSNAIFVNSFDVELTAVTPSGTVLLAENQTDDGPFPNQVPTLTRIPLEIGYRDVYNYSSAFSFSRTDLGLQRNAAGDVVLPAGTKLQLTFEVHYTNIGAAYSVFYDSASFPSSVTLPMSVGGSGGGTGGGTAHVAGSPVLAQDDPRELPAQYAGVDLRNANLTNDERNLTVGFRTYGLDASMPAPGATNAQWEFNFDVGGRTLGVWVVANGPVDPTYQAYVDELTTGWGQIAGPYPVVLGNGALATTIPFQAFAGASGQPLQLGNTLTNTFLETRVLVPGQGLPGAFVTTDYAPGGGPETTVTNIAGSGHGNDYTLAEPNGSADPSVQLTATPSRGDAPLLVTLQGHVQAGSAPLANVTIDLDDGQGPRPLDLASDGSFQETTTYRSPGTRTATVVAQDTGGRATARSVDVHVTRGPGVYVALNDGPQVLATEDGANWSSWHLDQDLAGFAPGTTLTLTATYYDGQSTSAPVTRNVTVVAPTRVAITSPDDGAYVDPGQVILQGTVSTGSGSIGGNGSSGSTGSATTASTAPWAGLPGDANHDGIQDALARHMDDVAPTDRLTLRVLLDHEATPADAADLQRLGAASRSVPLHLIDAVTLEGVPAWAVPALLQHPGAVRVEWVPPAKLQSSTAIQATLAEASATYGSACVWGGDGCLGFTGQGVTVAAFDSGVRTTHEDFLWGAYAPPGAASTDSKIVGQVTAWPGQVSNGDHATATAGLAVGTGGLPGVHPGAAPGANLVSVQATSVPGSAGTITTRTCEAFDDVLAWNQAHPAEAVRVATLSYGSLVPLAGSDDACVNAAVDAGIVVVIAAGNYGTMGSPGTAAKAITVGNQDDFGTVDRTDDTPCHGAFYEGGNGYGGACGVSGMATVGTTTVGKPEVYAPGTCVLVATNAGDSTYNACGSGTSYSTPIVAGIVALMLQANPSLTPAQVKTILEDTAHLGNQAPTGVWNPATGYGFVDAHAAVAAAVAAGGASAPLSASAGGPYSTAPGVAITLDASVTGGTSPYTYAWDLGDGNTSTAASPSHAWSSVGTYPVHLLVTDANGTTVRANTTVQVADTLSASIATPPSGTTVSGNLTVTGTAYFPPAGGSATLDLAKPLWTDPRGDACIACAGNATSPGNLDIVAGYAWNDTGASDPTLNLGLRVANLSALPSNEGYDSFELQFTYHDKQYMVQSLEDPEGTAAAGSPDLQPRFLLYARAAPIGGQVGSFSQVAPVTGSWNLSSGLVTWVVPKVLVNDTSGNRLQPGDVLTGFLGESAIHASAAPVTGLSLYYDDAPAPADVAVTVGGSTADPHVVVSLGGGPSVRASGTSTWTATVDTTQVPDGSADLVAQALDGQGRASDPAVVQVNVANGGTTSGPNVTFTNPSAGATVAGNVTFQGTATNGTTGTAQTAALEPIVVAGEAPLRALVRAYPAGPTSRWILDWGDGTVVQGDGSPLGLHGHVYRVPGSHRVTLTTVGTDGTLAATHLTVQASSDPAAEPGPSNPTLYFHMHLNATTGTTVDRQWVNADPNDPNANGDGAISSAGAGGSGGQVWPLDPAPTQDLQLVPGGVAKATLEYEGVADLTTNVTVSILVDGNPVGTGSTIASFLADQATVVHVDVHLDAAWSGLIPAGSQVTVVTHYRTPTSAAGQDWVGIHGFDTTRWSLTLPFGSGGGSTGGTVEQRTWYAHDVNATWSSCEAGPAPLTTAPPTGEPDAGRTFLPPCTGPASLELRSQPLAGDLHVSPDEPTKVVAYLGTWPFADVGAAPDVTFTATVGTVADPTLVGTATATVDAVHTGTYPTQVVMTLHPDAAVTLPAGASLAARISLDPAGQGTYFGPPYAVTGGGQAHPMTVALPLLVPTTPSQVTGLAATAGDGQVTLAWNAAAHAAWYHVLRDGVQVGNTTSLGYTDAGLANGVAYTYTVQAGAADGSLGPASDPVSATPHATTSGDHVDVTVQDASTGTTVLPSTPATGVATWSLPWDTTQVPDGDYVATATLTTSGGATATATRAFTVANGGNGAPAAPTVTLQANRTTLPAGGSVALDALLGGGNATTITWDLGDGTRTTNVTHVDHTYASPGTYTVTVTATNAGGTGRDQLGLTVVGAQQVEVRVPGSVDAWTDATPTGPNGSFASWTYAWDASNLRGAFTLEARWFDGLRTTAPVAVNVTVDAAPAAQLVATPGSAPTGTNETLDGSGSSSPVGTVATYRFDPGDGTGEITSADATVTHAYANPGTYHATLVVVDDLGRSSAAANATVEATNRAPQAAVAVAGSFPTLQNVTFDGSGSRDPDGSVVSWAWSFGDGATAAGPTATHAYVHPGTYVATLTVTDDLGATSSASRTLRALDRPPVASVTVTNATAPTLVPVAFDASASRDADGSVVALRFVPGDGTGSVTTTDLSVSHVYTTPGTYHAVVEVQDDVGNWSGPEAVTVHALDRAPTVALAVAPHPTGAGVPTTLDLAGTRDLDGSVATLVVDPGDGTGNVTLQGGNTSTQHVYAKPGTYDVRVTATDELGNTSVLTRPLVVATVLDATQGTWHASLQDAVDHASAGDILVARPATYEAPLVVDTPGVTLCSTGALGTACDPQPGNVTLHGSTAGAMVTVAADDVTLDGFTLRWNGTPAAGDVEAVHLAGVDHPLLANLTIEVKANPCGSAVPVTGACVGTSTTNQANGVAGRATGLVLRDSLLTARPLDPADGALAGTDGIAGSFPAARIVGDTFEGWAANGVALWGPRATVASNSFLGVSTGVLACDGADHVTVTGNAFVGPQGVSLCGNPGPASVNITGNDLRATGVALNLTASTHDLSVRATCDDWGAYTSSAIPARIHDAGTANRVTFRPFVAPTLSGMGCLHPPEAAFDASPNPTDRLHRVNFTDASQAGDRPIVSWSWSFGDGATSTQRNPTHVYDHLGRFTATLTVRDVEGLASVASERIVVTNRPPTVDPVASQRVDHGAALAFRVTATDPEGDPLTLSLPGAPDGVQATSIGTGRWSVAWAPTLEQSGTHDLVLAVSDGYATTREVVPVVVVDHAPTLQVVASLQEATVGRTLQVPLRAADPEGDPVTVAATDGLPANATLDPDPGMPGTWILAWTPRAGDDGTHVVNLTASDGLLTVNRTLQIRVGHAPAVAAPQQVTVLAGSGASFDVSATDPDVAPSSLTFRALVPYGTLQDHGNGTATVHLQVPGSVWSAPDVLVTADDGRTTTTVPVHVVVLRPPDVALAAPSVAGQGLATSTFVAGESAILRATGSDPGGAVVNATFTLDGVPVPTMARPGGLFESSPLLQTALGTHTFRFEATDDTGLTSNVTGTFRVVANQAPSAAAAHPNVEAHGLHPIHLDGTPSVDPDGRPLTYAWTLPDGRVVRSANATWTPDHLGRFDATLRVTDDVGAVANVTVPILVDDQVRGSAGLLGADASHVGPTERPLVAVLVEHANGTPLVDTPVNLRVLHSPTGTEVTNLTATTDGNGRILVRLPYDTGSGGLGTNLPGPHTWTVSVAVSSSVVPGEVLRASYAGAYTVAGT